MGDDSCPKAPPAWDLVEDRLLNACRVWDLRARRFRHPRTKKEGDFFYLNSRDWVNIVARTVDGGLVLVRQFRWGANALSWEFPGGIIDAGEDPVEAGLRELKEETGYIARKGRLIGRCQPNPAILDNYCHFVYAEDAELADEGTAWDEHEELEVQVTPEADVFEWARTRKIEHALSLNALLYYGFIKT